jgi:hypothetical protein
MPYVTGMVTDQSHRPIENATIALPSAGLFALSDEKGFFEIPDVPPGIQRFNVVHRNFQKFVADLRIAEDMTVYIDLDNQ